MDKLKLKQAYECQYAPRWGVHLAFAKITGDTAELLYTPTTCKDYMTDTLSLEEEGNKTYGGFWGFKGPTVHENTVIAISDGSLLKDNILLFQEYELSLGLEPVQLFETQYDHWVVLKADKWWSTTTIHLSLFLSWMRNLNQEKVDTLEEAKRDGYISTKVKQCLELPKALMKLNITIKRNAPSQNGMHSMNGHHFLITTTNQHREKTTYGPQLIELSKEHDIFYVPPAPTPQPQGVV